MRRHVPQLPKTPQPLSRNSSRNKSVHPAKRCIYPCSQQEHREAATCAGSSERRGPRYTHGISPEKREEGRLLGCSFSNQDQTAHLCSAGSLARSDSRTVTCSPTFEPSLALPSNSESSVQHRATLIYESHPKSKCVIVKGQRKPLVKA